MGPGKKPAEQNNPGEEGGTPSPGVIGGAALIGATAGLILSGPLVGVALGAGAALTTLRKDQVGRERGKVLPRLSTRGCRIC